MLLRLSCGVISVRLTKPICFLCPLQLHSSMRSVIPASHWLSPRMRPTLREAHARAESSSESPFEDTHARIDSPSYRPCD